MNMDHSPASIGLWDEEMQAASSRGAARELPRYKCHKEVWALKIKTVAFGGPKGIALILTPEEEGYAPFGVDAAYALKHNPKPGGYYVVYADGYKSYSPAQAFEEGYARL